MKLWHCTPRENEAVIDREGLCPRFGWTITSDDRKWCIDPIHLAEMSLEDFIADLQEANEVVLYEVFVDGLTLRLGHDGWGSWAMYEWIRPERLRKVAVYNALTGEYDRSVETQWQMRGVS